MADEVTLVSPRGNEVTVSDPAGIGNLIGDGYRYKADPDPVTDEVAEVAETPDPPKRSAKADTQEREASGR